MTGSVASTPRNLIVAESGSQVTVVESYGGAGDSACFTNAVTEIVVGDGASVAHYKIERESERAFHVATIHARQGRGASFTSHSVALGGALVRNDIRSVLAGEGADCALNGLYLLRGRQHVDHHTVIDHAAPHGTSRELYKGVLDGSSRGVFDGKIIVRPDAQKTDAQQVNRNLIISDEALVDTKPQLEIRADDVKCTHAATIGRIDPEMLFYLRSRAIDERTARGMLLRAFVGDVLGRMKVEPLRAGLESLLAKRMAPAGAGEAA
jgi:Fe-S cluster assembly protein SufD